MSLHERLIQIKLDLNSHFTKISEQILKLDAEIKNLDTPVTPGIGSCDCESCNNAWMFEVIYAYKQDDGRFQSTARWNSRVYCEKHFIEIVSELRDTTLQRLIVLTVNRGNV